MPDKLNSLLADCSSKASQSSLNVISLEKISSPEEALQNVTSFHAENPADCSGWLCFTGEVEEFIGAYDFLKFAGRILLSGELACGAKSLHLRQSENGWNIFRFERVEGGDMLMFEESYVSIRKELGKLRYETFWRKEKNNEELEVFRPYVSRFAGFAQGGN